MALHGRLHTLLLPPEALGGSAGRFLPTRAQLGCFDAAATSAAPGFLALAGISRRRQYGAARAWAWQHEWACEPRRQWARTGEERQQSWQRESPENAAGIECCAVTLTHDWAAVYMGLTCCPEITYSRGFTVQSRRTRGAAMWQT